MTTDTKLDPLAVAQIDQLILGIGENIRAIQTLPPHRTLSLAVTKLEEARHRLMDRLVQEKA